MIYLCDFEDSFTYNIFTELKLLGLDVTIISKKEVPFFLETKMKSTKKEIILLGPGPGHPKEYQETLVSLKKALAFSHLYFYGICLGHQLICECLGLDVERSYRPIHGESVSVDLSLEVSKKFNLASHISVQRYNSLAVRMGPQLKRRLKKLELDYFFVEDDLMGMKGKNFLSYQFHPESVGTTFRSQFFRGLGLIES